MKGTVICEHTKINSLLVYRHTKKQSWRKEERQDITNKKREGNDNKKDTKK
jgi:hypothetical protein